MPGGSFSTIRKSFKFVFDASFFDPAVCGLKIDNICCDSSETFTFEEYRDADFILAVHGVAFVALGVVAVVTFFDFGGLQGSEGRDEDEEVEFHGG